MDTTEKSPVVLSLCTGLMRGLERGVEEALGVELRTAAYVEIEAFAVANLIAGMEAGILDPVPVWSNLKTFPWEQFHGKVHGILGGYPCQPFSVAGNRGGKEDPRHLWPYIAEGIRAVGPLWCFFENVGGHLTLGYETVRGELQDMGYRVEEGIFSAEEVGAPHRRERLFILAILGNTKYNGLTSAKELRSHEKTSNKWGKEKQNSSGKFKRTDRSFNVSGLYRCEERKELANTCICLIQKWQKFGRLWTEFERTSEAVGDPYCSSAEYKISTGGAIIAISNESNKWPSRAGEQQYYWEEPRTVKSGVGCTVNGYNFREDLLRGLGNGVVWQTAELAFRTLLKNHSHTRKDKPMISL